jgi:hypothetical protein
MRPFLAFMLAAGACAVLVPLPGAASLQPHMYCWSGDSEFPVACEDEGEDDEARPGNASAAGPGRPAQVRRPPG